MRYPIAILVLFLHFFATLEGSAAVWSYWTEDNPGLSLVVHGKFTTDGTYEDTQGSGSTTFTIVSWDEWFLTGVDHSTHFKNGPPTILDTDFNEFTWSRDSQSATAFEGGKILVTDGTGESGGRVQLAFVGSGHQSEHIEGSPNINETFLPTITTVTPVPEPEHFAVTVIIGLLILASIAKARKSRGTRHSDTIVSR